MTDDSEFSENELFDFNKSELSKDNLLFTDVVVQLIGSWTAGDIKVVNTVVDSISEELGNNETVMVGLLFASMLHISKLIHDVAILKGQSANEAWLDFLQDYNKNGREAYSQIPVLHPAISERIAKEMYRDS